MTSQNSDLAQFVKDSGSGILIDENVEQSEKNVRALMRDSERLASFGRAGRNYVGKYFSREVISGKYDDLCIKMVGRE
jgi:glycosyltransferase involved in cell wall biosynthesis